MYTPLFNKTKPYCKSFSVYIFNGSFITIKIHFMDKKNCVCTDGNIDIDRIKLGGAQHGRSLSVNIR